MKVLHILVFLCLCSFSIAAPAHDDTYNRLVKCLTKRSIPRSQVQEMVYNPTSASFTPILQAYIRNLRFNFSTTPKPNIIITPKQESHVQAAVICSKKLGLHIKIRSGGNDYEGLSYVSSNGPFTLLDMSNFQAIDVDIESGTAWVQTSALVGQLYYRISEKSKLYGFPAGTCVNVGIGGQLSGAGYGNLLRQYGLTVDNVVDARIVDVNGKLLDRKGMGEDLFWAINGGGGASFGVVLAFKIKLVPVPPVVTVFNVGRTLAENATDIVFQWQSLANKIDRNLFVRLQFTVVTQKNVKTIRASFKAEYLGSANTLLAMMNYTFPQLGLKKEDCTEMSWIESTLFWDNFDAGTPPNVLLSREPRAAVKFAKRRTDYIQTPIPVQGLESLWKKMIELGNTSIILNPYGGRMDEILPTATAFPHREGIIFMIQYLSNWFDDADTNEIIRQGKELYEFMTPSVSKNPRKSFFNYRDIDVGSTTNGANSYEEAKVYGEKYYGVNFDRLVKVKTAVDPGNFFRNEQSIPVAPGTAKPRNLAALQL